ncbi:MAG: 16S rRNA (uracil(1498)-N(3))-methyltransferase [Alphaproteobacteria bacterium]|nr:16S rRNA (uracil(1498)-N(3))-methyltransferase [Alphaproteobacteria bacterium]
MATPKIRLYVDAPLAAAGEVALDADQAHYLRHVMRQEPGAGLALFNGRDGEWLAIVESFAKKSGRLRVQRQLRPQTPEPDLWLAFAPLKHARIDFLAEKASELGVSVLQPTLTRFTAVTRVNVERLAANAREAAELTHRLTVPAVRAPMALDKLLAAWPRGRTLVFCDETGQGRPAIEALGGRAPGPAAILIGPEAGFSDEERRAIRALPDALAVDLGPRLMRAETAAIAALAAFQALAGDWRRPIAKSLTLE